MKEINYKTTKANQGFQELIYSDNDIQIIILNKQRNNSQKEINYKLKVYKIAIDSIVKVKTDEEGEEDGEIIWYPHYRDVKIVSINLEDEYGYIYEVESLGSLKSRRWIREENIVEVIE